MEPARECGERGSAAARGAGDLRLLRPCRSVESRIPEALAVPLAFPGGAELVVVHGERRRGAAGLIGNPRLSRPGRTVECGIPETVVGALRLPAGIQPALERAR